MNKRKLHDTIAKKVMDFTHEMRRLGVSSIVSCAVDVSNKSDDTAAAIQSVTVQGQITDLAICLIGLTSYEHYDEILEVAEIISDELTINNEVDIDEQINNSDDFDDTPKGPTLDEIIKLYSKNKN